MSASFLAKPPRSTNCRAAIGSSSSAGGPCGSMPRSRWPTCSRQCFSRSPSVNAVERTPEKTLTALSERARPLNVERLPRAALFVLGERHAVVRIVVALVAHVRKAGHRAALSVLRQQAVRPADRRVGVVVGSHRTGAGVHPDLAT